MFTTMITDIPISSLLHIFSFEPFNHWVVIIWIAPILHQYWWKTTIKSCQWLQVQSCQISVKMYDPFLLFQLWLSSFKDTKVTAHMMNICWQISIGGVNRHPKNSNQCCIYKFKVKEDKPFVIKYKMTLTSQSFTVSKQIIVVPLKFDKLLYSFQ